MTDKGKRELNSESEPDRVYLYRATCSHPSLRVSLPIKFELDLSLSSLPPPSAAVLENSPHPSSPLGREP